MAIHLPLKKLTFWQQCVFAAALLERMLPNYQMFAEACGDGDSKLLRNQLDLVWQWLDKSQKCKINTSAQLEKLELQVPDPEQYDFFGVYPALDTCMALHSLLQGISDKSPDNLGNIGRLSANSVSFYLELVLAEELSPGQEITDSMVKQHPLMQWERETQNELFDYLQAAPENKVTLKQAKSLVLSEGLSNLGIEIYTQAT